LKIELTQSHKLSWCLLLGFNGHIVFMVQEGRSFTAADNNAAHM
jgi:hypothetical protein